MSRTPPPPSPHPGPSSRQPDFPTRGSPSYDRRFAKPTMHPRRVTGGIRLQFKAGAVIAPGASETEPSIEPASDIQQPTSASGAAAGWSWASARWMRLAEDFAPGEQLAEGLEYARIGQTRTLELKPGQITARVQGRMPSAYKVSLRLPTFTPDQWENVATAMAAQARYAAALLAGELPANIEDLFIPAGLHLFPGDPSGLSCSCDCDIFIRSNAPPPPAPGKRTRATQPPAQPWCKHICCVMFLIAERLAVSPLTIFALRGLPEADLLERLRQQRALAGMQRAGNAAAPVYSAHVAGLPRADAPLEESAHHFWTPAEPDALDALDMPIEPPEVSHPLLRRVGPSPFTGAKFPLVGLLATCYDVISEATIRNLKGEAPASSSEPTPDASTPEK